MQERENERGDMKMKAKNMKQDFFFRIKTICHLWLKLYKKKKKIVSSLNNQSNETLFLNIIFYS